MAESRMDLMAPWMLTERERRKKMEGEGTSLLGTGWEPMWREPGEVWVLGGEGGMWYWRG